MRSKTNGRASLNLMACAVLAATGCTDPVLIAVSIDAGTPLDAGPEDVPDAAPDAGPEDLGPEDVGPAEAGPMDAGAPRITFIKPRATVNDDLFGGSVAWLEDKLVVGGEGLSDCGYRDDAGAVVVDCSNQGALTVVDLSAEPADTYTIVKPNVLTNRFSKTVVTSSTHVAAASSDQLDSEPVASVFVLEHSEQLAFSQRLTSPAAIERFGHDVALQDDWLAVFAGGSVCPDVPCTGDAAVHLYRNNNGRWLHEQALVPTAFGPAAGLTGDLFGSVSLDSKRLAIGLPHDDRCVAPRGPCPRSGSVHLYSFDGTAFVFDQRIEAPTPRSNARFGAEVQLHGSMLVVGAPGSREVLTYRLRASGWRQVTTSYVSNADDESEFGAAIDIDGSRMLVGAPNEHNCSMGYADPDPGKWDPRCSAPQNGGPDLGTGAAFLYERRGDAWVLNLYLKPNTTVPGLEFGASVALGRDAVAIGAPKEITGASGIDPAPAAIGSPRGAAFVYETRKQ